MKTQRLLASVLLACGCAAGAYADTLPSIEFSGDSTLHEFSGRANAETFAWQQNEDAYQAAMSIKGGSLTTDSTGRDRNMWRMLEVERFPTLSGQLADVPSSWLAGTNESGALTRPIQLTLRDRTLAVPATLQIIPDAEGTRFVDIRFVVSLAAFGMRPPAVLGVIRVRDTVDVHIQLPLPDKETPAT